MNLGDITTKCFILALIIRDDGQRLLLGDGYYEFKHNLQHFQPNTYQNDVVELQGTDGQLLAGQVRRTATQTFNGYIGDATVNRQTIEQKRREFMTFFRKKHFYKVVYIFPDGTAIQRKRGYIVNAPSVPEMWQRYPEYSIGLSFEDVNYYEYAEDEHGDEIYAHIVQIALAAALEGGLVWDAIGAVSDGITWSQIQTAQGEYIDITNALDIPVKLTSVEMLGKATQSGTPTPDSPIPVQVVTGENVVKIEGGDGQGQEYTIDLDTLELAKIGNYQDYIWKDGDDWKVHEEVGKVVLDGSESGWNYNSGNKVFFIRNNEAGTDYPSGYAGYVEKLSDHFAYYAQSGNNASLADGLYENTAPSYLAMMLFHYSAITSLSGWTSWLALNPTTVYYALATPTDTTITNQTLIDQLNAIGNAKLFVGQNNIGTTTLNATPTLELEYYGDYSEEGAGYEWEAGGGSQNIITVDGVDNALPIWTVIGPASNPTLTNITTGQTISWQGFVPNGQTLTINMNEMTADLAGANVFEFITGEWIQLQPGNNTLVYNAGGGATDDSTLSWNGVAA